MTIRRAITNPCFALFALVASFYACGARADAPAESRETSNRSPLAVSAVDDPPAREAKPNAAARKDNVDIGGVVGAGFPRPLAVEVMLKAQRLVSIGVEYSVLPAVTILDVNTSFWALAADMRVFPFRNGFFVGLRAGRQVLTADMVVAYDAQSYAIATEVQTMFVNPRIGVLWTWSSGFTLGFDAGLQIPVSSRSSGALAAAGEVALPEVMEIVDEVRSVTDYLGKSTIPTIDLLRIGLLL